LINKYNFYKINVSKPFKFDLYQNFEIKGYNLKRNKVTLKEMAKILDVSVATISKALRDSDDISDHMVKKVKKLASELGYRPNRLARGLINKKSYLIGAIIPDLRISFFSEAARGIYEQSRRRDYQAILMVNDENPDIERENLEFLSDIKVDGILLNNAPGDKNYQLYRQIADEGVPTVCWDRRLDELGFSSVTIDDRKASYQLTNKLIEEGRENILYMGPNKGFSVVEDRFKGYCDAMQENGLGIKTENRCLITGLQPKDCYRSLKNFLYNGNNIDAVLCIGGIVAYGAGHAILESGLSIPDDIMMAEFGDNDIVAQLGVPFYTIEQNPYEIGQTAIDLLLEEIDHDSHVSSTKHVIIETKLIHHKIGKPFFKPI
jgi:LacI family transcriptional regulator